MNSWPEISKKYKETPKMATFREWCFKNGLEDGGHPTSFTKSNIKTIFGFLQCYAVTLGQGITLDVSSNQQPPRILALIADINDDSNLISQGFKIGETEKAMLWVINKYFGITKGE